MVRHVAGNQHTACNLTIWNCGLHYRQKQNTKTRSTCIQRSINAHSHPGHRHCYQSKQWIIQTNTYLGLHPLQSTGGPCQDPLKCVQTLLTTTRPSLYQRTNSSTNIAPTGVTMPWRWKRSEAHNAELHKLEDAQAIKWIPNIDLTKETKLPNDGVQV